LSARRIVWFGEPSGHENAGGKIEARELSSQAGNCIKQIVTLNIDPNMFLKIVGDSKLSFI